MKFSLRRGSCENHVCGKLSEVTYLSTDTDGFCGLAVKATTFAALVVSACADCVTVFD